MSDHELDDLVDGCTVERMQQEAPGSGLTLRHARIPVGVFPTKRHVSPGR